MTHMNEATIAQVRAADPAASTWVSANAGSGKTRVLTDRVARLLLQGTPPQKILCLTYTKAAASHMQNQLFTRLGEWAMLEDSRLRIALSALGEHGDQITPKALRSARTLFARALETPGGLKIQTIHSFCASLLRRFPLEAGVSPQFQEMDNRSGKKLRAEILEDLAEGVTQPVFDGMAHYLPTDDADSLMQEIAKNRQQFLRHVSATEIWAEMGLPTGFDQADLLAEAFPDWAGDVLPDLIDILQHGLPTDLKNRDKLAKVDLNRQDVATLVQLENVFVFARKTKKQFAAKIGSFPTKDLRDQYPDLIEAVQQWMLLIENAGEKRRALEAAEKTAALHDFAAVFLPEYARRKSLHGWLDFDDLILKARDLLTDSATAQWILFRLDGGIDHILVDEAQDTSPAQWDVITKLAEEFTTGQGARDTTRTIFVVGDEKQSIYSFQGADPVAFGAMRQHFADHLARINSRLERQDLLFSFRSADAILRLVDAVMLANNGQEGADRTLHRAFHENLPGRVDLWPFLPKSTASADYAWDDPVDVLQPDDPALLLAGQVADQIADLLHHKTALQFRDETRRISAGDFLILVQRRSDLFHEIIRALKDRGIAVAGADRLKIGGELAVKDLLALLSFMALPEDDLSLACAMRSPLLGLSESRLYTLSVGRKASLWQSLRTNRDLFADVFDLLNDLLAGVDFLRPYDLLERILTRHNGRKNLIARLGSEAEDGIDALLAEALRYEATEAPSLTAFLGWMESGEVEIKRQMDAASDQVRVMTVHGAKGLESPIVILPDTAKRTIRDRAVLATLKSGVTAWKTGSDDSPAMIRAAQDQQNQLQASENQRLLYVAMTRAANWLIVCGAGDPGKDQVSWYNQVEQAMDVAGAVTHEFASGQGKRVQSQTWTDNVNDGADSVITPPGDLPDWAMQPAPAVKAAVKTLSPSDLGGEKILAGDSGGLDEKAAMQRGRHIHLLLEHLPTHSPDQWPALAKNLLSHSDDPASAARAADVLAEVTPILQNPDLAFLFEATTLAEVPVFATLGDLDDQPIYGFIDRLICDDRRILAVDFKSNAAVPDTAATVPDGILRQMAAYAAALGLIYPDQKIETAILWTKTGNLMPLPHDIVRQSLKPAPTS